MEWFEDVERYHDKMDPLEFSYSLLTRSLRINHANLEARDANLVKDVDTMVLKNASAQSGVKVTSSQPIFTPFRLREMLLENRIMMSPMCMYSAENGLIGDWHLVHLGSRAMGGAGLIMAECTAISKEGRITPGCAGLYSDEHVVAWKKITDFVH